MASALSKRVARLEVEGANGVGSIGRLVMVTGPEGIEPAAMLAEYGIEPFEDDFYIRLVGVSPNGGKPADLPCSIKIAGKWLVVDGKRTEVQL